MRSPLVDYTIVQLTISACMDWCGDIHFCKYFQKYIKLVNLDLKSRNLIAKSREIAGSFIIVAARVVAGVRASIRVTGIAIFWSNITVWCFVYSTDKTKGM